MLSYEFISHLIPSLFYLTIISLVNIRVFTPLDFLSLWSGGLIGTYLLDIDHIIYCFLIRPEKSSSLQVRDLYRQKKYKQALIALVDNHFEHTEMNFHNAVFVPIWIAFCFFILSSSGSLFAGSLVMTMFLHLLKDVWEMVRKTKTYDLPWFFWQIKASISLEYKKYYVWVITLAFLLESLFFVRI